MEEDAFLGHVLSAKGVAVDPNKIEVVSKWQSPKSVTEICSFLGLAGYYHRFIENFSKDCKAHDRTVEGQHAVCVVGQV
jgi:hypothetical protein